MARYAVIENGKVINIVESDVATANKNGWIPAISTTKKGDLVVDGDIVPVADRLTENKVDPIKFQLLFTFQERIDIRSLADTDPGCKELLRMVDDVRLLSIDLNLKSTGDALDYLVSKTLITLERKGEILQGIIK